MKRQWNILSSFILLMISLFVMHLQRNITKPASYNWTACAVSTMPAGNEGLFRYSFSFIARSITWPLSALTATFSSVWMFQVWLDWHNRKSKSFHQNLANAMLNHNPLHPPYSLLAECFAIATQWKYSWMWSVSLEDITDTVLKEMPLSWCSAAPPCAVSHRWLCRRQKCWISCH